MQVNVSLQKETLRLVDDLGEPELSAKAGTFRQYPMDLQSGNDFVGCSRRIGLELEVRSLNVDGCSCTLASISNGAPSPSISFRFDWIIMSGIVSISL